MTIKKEREILFHQFIDEAGKVVTDLPDFARDAENLLPLYRAMMLTRSFDEKAIALQRTGRLGTYASSLGQEGVGVGIAAAMRDDDVLLPSFRDQSAMLWRGVSMSELLLYWGGDERGSDFAKARHDFPICVPVATQFPHAVGAAMALKSANSDAAAVVIGGDGATSKGDFYEAINAAGLWRLPVVFVINNNQWAISVPRSNQTAAKTLAQKAVAAGIEGIQVDGNDVVGVHHIVSQALERARRKEGPTLIEAVTYRLSDHTTADDASRYRRDEEVSPHWKKEPLRRLRNYLQTVDVLDHDSEEAMRSEISALVEDAATTYLETLPQKTTSMFDYLFATLPPVLQKQRDVIAAQGDGHARG